MTESRSNLLHVPVGDGKSWPWHPLTTPHPQACARPLRGHAGRRHDAPGDGCYLGNASSTGASINENPRPRAGQLHTEGAESATARTRCARRRTSSPADGATGGRGTTLPATTGLVRSRCSASPTTTPTRTAAISPSATCVTSRTPGHRPTHRPPAVRTVRSTVRSLRVCFSDRVAFRPGLR